jgi:predicted ATPase
VSAKRIVIIGGPGTGKTTLIHALESMGYSCFHEISRQVTLKAREEGVEHLFLTKPLLFSELLIKGRIAQFEEAGKVNQPFVFMDRGIPDVVAYMDFVNEPYPPEFINACEKYSYDMVFMLSPWREIYTEDNERYESFEEAEEIFEHLNKHYTNCGYEINKVPFDTVENRIKFMLDTIHDRTS